MKSKRGERNYWKAGTLIRCTSERTHYPDFFTKGKIYEVIELNPSGGVIKGDNGETINSWHADFEEIENKPKSFYDYEPGSLIHWDSLQIYHDAKYLNSAINKPFYNLLDNESMTQKVSKTMSSIIKKIKDIKLSQEDRLLRKHGFEDEDGKMTSEAMDLMDEEIQQERWEKRRLEIAADLKLVEAQEK